MANDHRVGEQLTMILAFALAAAQPAESPDHFVRRIYAGYAHEGYNPLAILDKVFAPTLAAAIRKDSSGREVGYLDGDPLCDCQDYERVTAQIRSLRQSARAAASARIHLVLGPKETRDLRLSLVLTRSGWRIGDVVGADGHSLLRELQNSNAKR
jgi:hypothetical protein